MLCKLVFTGYSKHKHATLFPYWLDRNWKDDKTSRSTRWEPSQEIFPCLEKLLVTTFNYHCAAVYSLLIRTIKKNCLICFADTIYLSFQVPFSFFVLVWVSTDALTVHKNIFYHFDLCLRSQQLQKSELLHHTKLRKDRNRNYLGSSHLLSLLIDSSVIMIKVHYLKKIYNKIENKIIFSSQYK